VSETGSSSNISIKQRIVGALVLVSLAVIFIPMVLDGEGPFETSNSKTLIPDEPNFKFESPVANAFDEAVKSKQITIDAADNDVSENRVSIVDKISEQAISEQAISEQAISVNSAAAKAAAKASAAKSRLVEKNKTGDTSDDVMPAPIASSPVLSPAKLAEPEAGTSPVVSDEKEIVENSRPLSKPAAAIAKLKQNKTQAVKSWSVQLGSFKTKPNALKLRDALRVKGFASYVEAVTNRYGERYRVRVGPELARANAEKLKKQLAKVTKLDGLIVSH